MARLIVTETRVWEVALGPITLIDQELDALAENAVEGGDPDYTHLEYETVRDGPGHVHNGPRHVA